MADPVTRSILDVEFCEATKGSSLIATICAVVSVSTLFLSARLYVRGKVLGKLHIDDYILLLGAACGWTCVILTCVAVHHGLGRYVNALTIEEQENTDKWTYLSFTPGILSFTVPKFAVVALLTRLLNPSRLHRIILWVLAGTCQVAVTICAVILFVQCTPTYAQWDFSVTNAKRWDPWILVSYAMFAGVFSALTDLHLTIYPTIVLFRLQLDIKRKLALCSALGIGYVSAVVAAYKSTRLPSLAGDDICWSTTDLVMWTLIEGSTIVIASCISLLQPLLSSAINTCRTLRCRCTSSSKNYGNDNDNDNDNINSFHSSQTEVNEYDKTPNTTLAGNTKRESKTLFPGQQV